MTLGRDGSWALLRALSDELPEQQFNTRCGLCRLPGDALKLPALNRFVVDG